MARPRFSRPGMSQQSLSRLLSALGWLRTPFLLSHPTYRLVTGLCFISLICHFLFFAFWDGLLCSRCCGGVKACDRREQPRRGLALMPEHKPRYVLHPQKQKDFGASSAVRFPPLGRSVFEFGSLISVEQLSTDGQVVKILTSYRIVKGSRKPLLQGVSGFSGGLKYPFRWSKVPLFLAFRWSKVPLFKF